MVKPASCGHPKFRTTTGCNSINVLGSPEVIAEINIAKNTPGSNREFRYRVKSCASSDS